MMELFKSSYYWLDLLVAYGGPFLLYLFYRKGKISRRDWRLFWYGVLIGLIWEIPIFLLSRFSSYAIISWIRELPIHHLLFLVGHSLWDGLLFVSGVWLVGLLLRPPLLTRFRWSELLILVLWGEVTAFLVEFSSITNDAWVWVEGHWWNPTLWSVGGHPITLAMQAIWFIAMIAFYFIALKTTTGADQK